MKPDFSGEWTLNRPASTLSEGASAIQSASMRIEHRDPVFRVQGKFVGDGDPVEFSFELTADDSEAAALRWDADAIVVTFRDELPGGATTIVFRYELHEDGRRLHAIETLRGPGREQDNLWVFDRR